MNDGGLLMPDPYNSITILGAKSILDHMIIKDCYEAGLISEDEWRSYLKLLLNINTAKEEDKDGQTQRLL